MTVSLLPVWAVLAPVIGLCALLLLEGRLRPEWVAAPFIAIGLYLSISIAYEVISHEASLVYALGGWLPPLGLTLRADGVGAVLLALTALVMVGVSICAWAPADGAGGRGRSGFWALLLALWSALNLAFIAQDLFNFFVALEMLSFSAVALVALDGSRDALTAALRYLLFALAGSVLYLLGVGMIYGRYAVLDLAGLREIAQADPVTLAALALMTVGLMAKAALFPLHLWLPPAHASAPAPASAVLSALVVKAPFLIILRLWVDLLPLSAATAPPQILAGLGSVAILLFSILALRQQRLKLMIAYSTLAQIGYLFLMFPLMPGPAPWLDIGWTGGILQLVSHGIAKAAMFLAAGLIYEALGHDRVSELAGLARRQPMTLVAFAIAGLSLMGLPPSGGFIAKLLLLTAAVEAGAWWIAIVVLAGGILAAFYVFRALGSALAEGTPAVAPVALYRQGAVLALALCALALGFVPLRPFALLAIGRPLEAMEALP
ncbi:complex I subunit 5 family protein [Ancylobacter defluvii]|uniref:NADH dehydrogenase n=1 Tax=Ancylobacter defluvii TaxID=1282440 RepID=A0A9W6K3W2_9HYPH|nr:proton-conducting transporter membrane subunit [Ancylobacter defluvii]MBS7588106.1 NADH-quinone oxidoreductase subunit J [Ancylobacter defluvii]GLK86498.1 NADH dehydrogenase [Ancylobacter defluvii]